MLRKYHFDKHFKGESDSSVRAEIWNGNYIKLVDDVKYLLTGSDKLMEKLKDDYKWELHFPEQIQDFKFANFVNASLKEAHITVDIVGGNHDASRFLSSAQNYVSQILERWFPWFLAECRKICKIKDQYVSCGNTSDSRCCRDSD